jgi:hypothetical protein
VFAATDALQSLCHRPCVSLAPKALSRFEARGHSPQGTKIAVQSSAESAFQWDGHLELALAGNRAFSAGAFRLLQTWGAAPQASR